MAAEFRASMAGYLAEPAWKVPLKRLRSVSPEFRAAWDRHEVVSARSERQQVRNAHVGPLTLGHTDPWLGPHTGPRMVTYVLADEESRARPERLQEPASRTG